MTLISSRLPAAATLLILCTSLAAAAAAGRPLTVDDLLALKHVSDPRVSPDGKWNAYVVEHVDAEKDEAVTTVHVVSAGGRESRSMTTADRSATTPRWSPNGRYLTFLGPRAGAEDEDAKPQVWTLATRGGEAQAWTDVEQGVSDFGWAPSGERMWVLIGDLTAEDLEARRAEEAGEEEPRPLPWVIDRLQFKRDGTTYLDRSRTHIYIVDGRGAEPRQLTYGDYDDGDPTWSPDGRQIAFVSKRTDEPDNNDNSDIWIVPVSGASEVLYVANYGHDHYQYQWEMELGLPWENREAWDRISPFNDVDKVTTPTLVIGGKEDWNVPINNSEQLYQALKRRGIDTQLVVYPGESHGIARPSFIRDRYQPYLAWYDRTVRGGD